MFSFLFYLISIKCSGLNISSLPISQIRVVAQEAAVLLNTNLTPSQNVIIYYAQNCILSRDIDFSETNAAQVLQTNCVNITKMTILLGLIEKNITERASTCDPTLLKVLGDVYSSLSSIAVKYMTAIDASIFQWVSYRADLYDALYAITLFLNIKLSDDPNNIIDDVTVSNVGTYANNFLGDVRNHVRGLSIVKTYLRLTSLSFLTMKILLTAIQESIGPSNPFNTNVLELIKTWQRIYSETNINAYEKQVMGYFVSGNSAALDEQLYGSKSLSVVGIRNFISIVEKYLALNL